MILNSKNSLFDFQFPKGFLYPEVEETYKIYLERFPIPFADLTSYLNFSVQSISWPSLAFENPIQSTNSRVSHYKTGYDAEFSYDKSITVTFRTMENFVNYFLMQEQILLFHRTFDPRDQRKQVIHRDTFLPDFQIRLLSVTGDVTTTIDLKKPVFKDISEMELSFASNIPEYKTFSVGFSFSMIEFNVQRD